MKLRLESMRAVIKAELVTVLVEDSTTSITFSVSFFQDI